MAIHTPTRRPRTRQYVKMLEDLSKSVEEKPLPGINASLSRTAHGNVQSASAGDAESGSSGIFPVEDRSYIKLEAPVIVSPTGTASTVSSPGLRNDIWDSPMSSNNYLSEARTKNALTPLTPPSAHDASLDSTPAPKARKAFLAKRVEDGTERNVVATSNTDHGAETKLRIDITQNEDYFFKPQKLIRNLTKELKAIADANVFPGQPRYSTIPDFNFEEAAKFNPSAAPRRSMIAVKHEAKSNESKSDLKVEWTAVTDEVNKTRPPLTRRSSKLLHKDLEHIVPMDIHSRVIEKKGKCVASKVGKPYERCSFKRPGLSIDLICADISRCDVKADPSGFIERIEQLIRASMCGIHVNVALSSKRQETLRDLATNFLHLSDMERSDFQVWVNAITLRGQSAGVQTDTIHVSMKVTKSADISALKAQDAPVAPSVTTSRPVSHVQRQSHVPGFEAFQPKRTQNMSIPAALREKIIEPLTPSAQKDGFIYVFWEKGQFGKVKIGLTTNLERRLKQWNSNCAREHVYHPVSQRGELAKIPYVSRVEQLIHIELKDCRRKRYCQRCAVNHIEWFEAGETLVTDIFRKWQDWIMQRPYAFDATTQEWILRPDMMDTLDQVCEPVAQEKKQSPPGRVSGAKGKRKTK